MTQTGIIKLFWICTDWLIHSFFFIFTIILIFSMVAKIVWEPSENRGVSFDNWLHNYYHGPSLTFLGLFIASNWWINSSAVRFSALLITFTFFLNIIFLHKWSITQSTLSSGLKWLNGFTSSISRFFLSISISAYLFGCNYAGAYAHYAHGHSGKHLELLIQGTSGISKWLLYIYFKHLLLFLQYLILTSVDCSVYFKYSKLIATHHSVYIYV